MEKNCGPLQLDHEKRISSLETSIKGAFSRMNHIEENQKILTDMNANIKVIAERYTELNKKFDKVETDLEELKGKPGKRYEQLVSLIMTVIISGVLGAFIKSLF